MRLERAILCGAMMLSLSACGGSKPVEEAQPVAPETSEQALFVQDMRMMCDAPNVQEVQDATVERRMIVLAQYISDRLQSERVKTLFAELATLSPDERAAKVQGAADEAGVNPCPIVGVWEVPAQDGDGEAEPAAAEPTGETSGSSMVGSQLKAVIAQHHNEVRFCFHRALRDDPSTNGKLTLSLAIEPDGSVRSATVRGSELPAAVGDCISKAASKWAFPEQGAKPVIVHYPFAFSASKA